MPLLLRLLCPDVYEEVDVWAKHTTITLYPEPVLLWPCPGCNGVHAHALDTESFDTLADLGYDIYGALGGVAAVMRFPP